MWLTFAVFHLGLLVLLLCVVWWNQILPKELLGQFFVFAQSLPAAIAGVIGLSVLAILGLWIKLWRKIYGKITTQYLFRDIDATTRDER
jgi:hypothetical protein